MRDEEFILKELATIDLRNTDDIVRVKGSQDRYGALRIACPKCKQPAGFPCFREAFKRDKAMGWGGRTVMRTRIRSGWTPGN